MSTKQAATFFRSRWVDAPAGAEQLDPAALAPGFRAAGAHCGLKGAGETDVGILACDAESVRSSLLLTRNAAAAAPVRVCREQCDRDRIRAAVVNSGNANAATGEAGYRDALAMRDATAAALGIAPRSVAVARDRRDRRAAADRSGQGGDRGRGPAARARGAEASSRRRS